MKKLLKRNRGITLVTLAVTIVLMLVMASITLQIALGNNGLINKTKIAKEKTEIEYEKETVKRAIRVALIETEYESIEEKGFKEALFNEAGERNVEIYLTNDIYEIVFADTNRYYQVDKYGNMKEDVQYTAKTEQYSGDLSKGGIYDGSESKPYQINCIEDLVELSKIVNEGNNLKNKFVQLNRDLNFESNISYKNENAKYIYDSEKKIYKSNEDSTTTIKELLNNNIGFLPIGIDYTTNYFSGTFNGQGHKIINLYINNYELQYIGLFGCSFGTIKNLGMVNSNLSGINVGTVCGILCSSSGITQYCYNINGNVIGSKNAGGIIGVMSWIDANYTWGAKLYNCYNTGRVNSSGNAGGITGYLGYGSWINYAYNSGNIAGNNTAGGIGGSMDFCDGPEGNFKYVYNIGKVDRTGTQNRYGALFGYLSRVKIQEAYYLKGSCSKAGSMEFGAAGTPVELNEDEMMKIETFIANYMT